MILVYSNSTAQILPSPLFRLAIPVEFSGSGGQRTAERKGMKELMNEGKMLGCFGLKCGSYDLSRALEVRLGVF